MNIPVKEYYRGDLADADGRAAAASGARRYAAEAGGLARWAASRRVTAARDLNARRTKPSTRLFWT